MARYLFQVAYSSPSWRTQVERPQDPRERVEPLAKELGGSLQEIYYCFGDYDVVAITELPDDDAAAAFALTIAAGGATKAMKTTKLLEVGQGLAAMRRAQAVSSTYTAPIRELAHT